MKQFLSVKDVNDIASLVDLALELKSHPLRHKSLGQDKTMVLLFFNTSLRTRLSTQKAAMNLGMNVMVMDFKNQGWQLEFESGKVMDGNAAEHVKEAAAVVSQYADIIGIRTFASLSARSVDYQEYVLSKFVEYASVPVVSLESATLHPLQSLTDLITIKEYQKTQHPKVVLSWAPHPRTLPQAVANSFLEWMAAANIEVTITHPEGADLAPQFSGNFQVEYDQRKAFEGADFVYTKNWSSYRDYGKRIESEVNWSITQEKMALTNDAHFMHCLPVRRNVVVEDAVIDSPKSLVMRQANNRTYAAQAVLKELLTS